MCIHREHWKIDGDLGDIVKPEEAISENEAGIGGALVLAEVLSKLEEVSGPASRVLRGLENQAVRHAQERGSSLCQDTFYFHIFFA